LIAIPCTGSADLEGALGRIAAAESFLHIPGRPSMVYLGLAFSDDVAAAEALQLPLQRFQERIKLPLGGISSHPLVLEAVAKAAAAGTILNACRVKPGDVEYVLEISRRFGARLVLPLGPAAGADELRLQLEEWRRLAEETTLRWENIYLDATSILDKTPAGAALLDRLKAECGARWAVAVSGTPAGTFPCRIDLVIRHA
jgi:hypothetical protein